MTNKLTLFDPRDPRGSRENWRERSGAPARDERDEEVQEALLLVGTVV